MFNIFDVVTDLGMILVLTGILDAAKYSLQARKIQQHQSAKGMSRKFINFAIINDVIRVCYGLAIHDWYIIASSILALLCMCDLFYQIYFWYPYKYRNLLNFKRPSIILYTINSILPNRIRRRL